MADKIKILHLYKSFFPETIGGVEQYIYIICQEMKKHGIESKIVCLTDEDESELLYDHIPVKRYKYDFSMASCPLSSKLLLNFKKESEWADIIHYHYPWPFADLLSLFTFKSKKQIVTYHSDIVKQRLLKIFYYPLEQYFLSKVVKIIATSPQYMKVSNNLKKFQSKVTVLPIPIDINKYSNPSLTQCNSIKKQFGDKFILFVGQLRYYKGLHLLVRAMQDLPQNLVIIGEGKEKAKLEKLCKENNINNVHFMGNLAEGGKINFLHACYALALPSHLKSEAFGISLLEGAAASKPLISCRIGTGTEYINQHMETGFVVTPNVREVKDAIIKLTNNPKLAKSLGRNARKRIENTFSSDIIGPQLSEIYKELLK